ncbi:non-heme iron oxygenase ferredoxin subunit [Nocardia sp. NPDC004860]|uniref:non-heme iron oxygenase ferredoxin subunit n=1 Tax=Nocardia sp. NPDC004860 TaxID=3154557 RepID=UPI0033B526F2
MSERRLMEGIGTKHRRFACTVDELDKGTSMTVPGDIPIALFRTDEGDFYATADICTHEEWSLGQDSDLEGNEVICPLHMARFDIRTGRPLCFPATVALATFGVEIIDGNVYVLG